MLIISFSCLLLSCVGFTNAENESGRMFEKLRGGKSNNTKHYALKKKSPYAYIFECVNELHAPKVLELVE